MDRCVVASGNAGKLRELGALLEPFGFQAVAQSEFGIEPPPEPHPTFIENALVKARHASQLAGMPAIADDSGVCVPSLGGAPGVYSARYSALAGLAAGDEANSAYLISQLTEFPNSSEKRNAFYVCALVWLAHADDPLPLIAICLWSGRIIDVAQGEGGFGYDAHFWLPALGKTAAQLSAHEKNAISHRGQAMVSLREQLVARHQALTDG